MTKPQNLEAQGKALVGTTALYAVLSRYPDQQSGTPDLVFPVAITEFRMGFGKLRVNIMPVGGEGNWWVEVNSPALRLNSK